MFERTLEEFSHWARLFRSVGWVGGGLGGWVGGWLRNSGNKANLSPASAGTWAELGKTFAHKFFFFNKIFGQISVSSKQWSEKFN